MLTRPPKLTWFEQQRYLYTGIIVARIVEQVDHGLSYQEAVEKHNLDNFRAALRLDDPILQQIIDSREGPLCWSSSSPSIPSAR